MKTIFPQSIRLLPTCCAAVWLSAALVLAQSPPELTVQVSNGTVLLSVTGDVGSACTIQWASNLYATSQWHCVTNIAPLSDSPTWALDTGAGMSPRFYRAYSQWTPANMALVPAGNFTMGNCMNTSDGTSFERPLHTLYVSACYMDQYQVTKALWDEVKAWNGGNGYSYDNTGSGKASTHPVHTVSWFDTVKWSNARSQMEGLTPCYYTDSGLTAVYKTGQVAPYVNWEANGYRLPTEAEWEKAARGGASGHRFPWSDVDTIDFSRANYFVYWSGGVPYYAYDVNPTDGYNPAFNDGVPPYTSPVGSFAANGYGLYDMSGNVLEWCWDWSGSSWYSDAGATQNDTRGPSSGVNRVMRGGSWWTNANHCRCSYRAGIGPTYAHYDVGFRCVRGL